MLVGDALDAFLEGGCSEIDQESERQVEKSEVCEDLFGVDGAHVFHGFKFYEQNIVYNDVCTEAFVEVHSHEVDRDRNLSFYAEPSLFQHLSKNDFVNAFQ